MSFATDPLSPFNDPHRDVDVDAPSLSEPAPPPAWPSTPHDQLLDNDASIVKPVRALSQTPPPRSANLDTGGPTPGPWGREPQIYGQQEPGLISPRETVASNGASFEKPDPYLRVRITALDRNRRDILIRFDAQTNLTNFSGTTYRNISRSYAEFQRFYEQIVYSNPQTIIPALPLAQTSAPSDEEDDRLVKVMLQRWFTRVCNDPILLSDEELRSFVESDFGYQPMPRPRRRTSSGFSLLGRRPPDEDEQLAQARFELTRLETQYIETAKAVDKLSQARKAMSFAHADMGNKLVDVAAAEIHPPLAFAVRKMGRSWHTYADLDTSQEISDRVILGDSLGYQGLNARSAKETLLQRSQVLEEYQDAVKTTIAKRRNIERLKASSNIRPERVDDALSELEEATNIETQIHRRVEGISQNLHRALVRHSRQAHEDLMVALIEHARTNIMFEKQLLRELESLRPDMKAAADPAPPPTSIPAVAAISPLAVNRAATISGGSGFRQPISTGHFLPQPTPSQQQPPALRTAQPHLGPEPINAPSPTSFVPATQVFSSDVPVTPASATMPGPGGSVMGGNPGPVPSFPRTSQFVGQESPAPITPGFPRTNQFASGPARPHSAAGTTPVTPNTRGAAIGGGVVNAPAATPITPGFPRTSQFTPGTPVMTPGFPKTNMFAPAGGATPSTPGFPKTNQFIGVSSPLSAGSGSGFSQFPRTSQFVPGANPLSPGAQTPLSPSPVGGVAANGVSNGTRSPVPARYDPSLNSPIARSASASPLPPSTPVKTHLGQTQSVSQLHPGQQPALPSQIQQQHQQLAQQQIDPLAGSRIISNQPAPSSPMLPPQTRSQSQIYSPSTQSQFQSPMSASIAGLPSRGLGQQSFGDPLSGGGGMSQSMFVNPTNPNANGAYGPLGGDIAPLGGTIRGTVKPPQPKRLDAREAASKLANFL